MTQTQKKTIWVIADDRAGNTAQSLGVAEATGMNVVIKNIQYTSLVKLPNVLRTSTLIGLTKESQNELTSTPFPDYAVTAGRRASPALRWIKKHSPKTKIIQIMFPGRFGLKDFDLIVLPEHDGFTQKRKNIMRVLGAPNRISEEKLNEEKKLWQNMWKNFPSPKIALIVGGKTKDRPFSLQDAENLADLTEILVQKKQASLFITTSRRTGDEQEALLKRRFPDSFFFSWKDASIKNPYFGFLACADILIVTGDSVSMCSEACSVGKPVYIFAPDTMCSKKHRRLHKALFEGGYALPLNEMSQTDFDPVQQLSVAKDVAERLKNV